MNLTSQEYLAKLLAKENLTIQHGNYQTASFDVVDRVLRLPLWEDKGKAVYDLLVGHEVGHALYTPCQGWHDTKIDVEGIPRVYLNIIEDIRIERKIQETYPGIVKQFKAGYKRLFDDNLFGTNDREVTTLMDKLNIHSKGRGIVPIEFDLDEQPLVDEAMSVQTWDDVVDISRKIHEFLQDKKDEQREETPSDETEVDTEGETGQALGESSETSNECGSAEETGQTSEVESDPTEGSTQPSVVSDDPTEAFTDETFRKNEDKLLETSTNRWGDEVQHMYTSGISKENISKVVVSFQELMKTRKELDVSSTCYVYSEGVDVEWSETKKSLESTANLLAKDFERKKAAFEYSRATVSKKGSLNMNKVHQYKYSEDIFLSVTKLAQAKSHGIVMFVDMSGSMVDIIADVIKQTLTIAMFCKKVGIPFDVYTFTSRAGYCGEGQGSVSNGNELENIESLRIVQVLSSSMKPQVFKLAMRDLFGMTKTYECRYNAPYYVSRGEVTIYDRMGTTPLIQTTIIAEDIVRKFQKKYGVQKTNIMLLTDGFSDKLSVGHDDSALKINSVAVDYNMVALNFKGKIIKGSDTFDLYKNCLGRLRELTGAKITGFFLAPKPRDFHHGIGRGTDYEVRKDLLKTWRKEHIVSFKDVKGYDDYFIVKVGDIQQSEEFSPKKTEKISDIRNEFRKFNKGKKLVKQLVNKITDAVAA